MITKLVRYKLHIQNDTAFYFYKIKNFKEHYSTSIDYLPNYNVNHL